MRRNPASQTIILSLSQCSSTAVSDASPANLLTAHFPVKSAGTATLTPQQRLTGGQPDVGTDGVIHRNPIRDWRSGPSRRKDCLKVAFKAPSLPISPRLGSTLPREYHGIDPMRPWKHQLRRAASRGPP